MTDVKKDLAEIVKKLTWTYCPHPARCQLGRRQKRGIELFDGMDIDAWLTAEYGRMGNDSLIDEEDDDIDYFDEDEFFKTDEVTAFKPKVKTVPRASTTKEMEYDSNLNPAKDTPFDPQLNTSKEIATDFKTNMAQETETNSSKICKLIENFGIEIILQLVILLVLAMILIVSLPAMVASCCKCKCKSKSKSNSVESDQGIEMGNLLAPTPEPMRRSRSTFFATTDL